MMNIRLGMGLGLPGFLKPSLLVKQPSNKVVFKDLAQVKIDINVEKSVKSATSKDNYSNNSKKIGKPKKSGKIPMQGSLLFENKKNMT